MRTKFDNIKPINQEAIVLSPRQPEQVSMPGSSIFVSQFEKRVGLSTIEQVVERTKRNRINGGLNPIVSYTYSNRKDHGPFASDEVVPTTLTHDGGIILFFYDGTQLEIARHTFDELKPYHEQA